MVEREEQETSVDAEVRPQILVQCQEPLIRLSAAGGT